MLVNHVVNNPTEKQRSLAKGIDFPMFKNSLFPKEFEDRVVELSNSANEVFVKLFQDENLFKLLQSIVAGEAYKYWRSEGN